MLNILLNLLIYVFFSRTARHHDGWCVYWVGSYPPHTTRLRSDSYRVLIGPPVGGALYSHLGFRAPFIFGIGAAVLDLIGRLLIVERREALYWGVDPAALPESHVETVNNTEDNFHLRETGSGIQEIVQKAEVRSIDPSPQSLEIRPQNGNTAPPAPPKPLSLVAVLVQLSKSPRALVALVVTFIYGSIAFRLFRFTF